MPNQYLIAAAAPARAITAKLYDEDVVLVDTAIDVSETVANTGAYTITFTNATELSGSYRLIMIDDVTGYGIAQYNAVLTGTTSEVVQAYEYMGFIMEKESSKATSEALIFLTTYRKRK